MIDWSISLPGNVVALKALLPLLTAADPAKFLATRQARQPIGRIPGADEVARAALFLLSPAASAVFGSTLAADGGPTAGFDFRTGEEGSSA